MRKTTGRKKKDPVAVALGLKRWKGVSKKARSKAMRALVRKREAKRALARQQSGQEAPSLPEAAPMAEERAVDNSA